MEPYRLPAPRAPLSGEPRMPDYVRFEQSCIYVLAVIAIAALAFGGIKIP